ncbi:MAG: hypothetical protein WC641_01585 [Patescibacteria group bacterium]
MKNGRLLVSLIVGLTAVTACSDNEPIDARDWSAKNGSPPAGGAAGSDGGVSGNSGTGAQAGNSGAAGSGVGGTSTGGTGASAGTGASSGTGGTSGTAGTGQGGSAGASDDCQGAAFMDTCAQEGAKSGDFVCACGLEAQVCTCRCVYTWLQNQLVPCPDGGVAGAGGASGAGGFGGTGEGGTGATGGSSTGGSSGIGGQGGTGASGGSGGIGQGGIGGTSIGGFGGTGASSGAGGTTPDSGTPTMRAVTYRWTLRAGLNASHLTGFDEVFDQNGNRIVRPLPCGANPDEAVYSWGAAQDCPNAAVCFSEAMNGQASYTCTIHRPPGAIPQTNAHIIVMGTNAGIWACASPDGSFRNATFEVWVDGISVPSFPVLDPQPGFEPFCRDMFQVP